MWVLLIHVVNTGEPYAFGFSTQGAVEAADEFYSQNPHVKTMIVYDHKEEESE